MFSPLETDRRIASLLRTKIALDDLYFFHSIKQHDVDNSNDFKAGLLYGSLIWSLWLALKRAGGVVMKGRNNLLGAGILGDGLGSLGDGVLSQFSGQEEPDSSLDLPGGDGGPLVVVGQTGSFSGDSFKNVVDKRVHDAHGL